MEVVVGRHPPFSCEVGWSVVGDVSGMISSYRDGPHVTVQRKGPSINAGGENDGTA